MGAVLKLTAESFEEHVLKASEIVVVDFSAAWCGPCQMVAPVLEEVAAEINGKMKICKIDIDESGTIADKYEILGVPTFIVFKEGKEIDRFSGYRPKEALKTQLQKYL